MQLIKRTSTTLFTVDNKEDLLCQHLLHPQSLQKKGSKGNSPRARKNLKSQECRLKSKDSFHKKSLKELETKWLGSNQSDLSLDEQVWLNRWISESLDQELLRKEQSSIP